MGVDAIVHSAPVVGAFTIPSPAAASFEHRSVVRHHRAYDELLDLDGHDCVRDQSECYLCDVQRAQREGRRV